MSYHTSGNTKIGFSLYLVNQKNKRVCGTCLRMWEEGSKEFMG